MDLAVVGFLMFSLEVGPITSQVAGFIIVPSVLIAAFQLSFEDHYKMILQPWFVNMTEI